MNTPADLQELVTSHTQALLADLPEAGAPQHTAALDSAHGWTVLLAIFPTREKLEATNLTPCDKDCLSILATSEEPLSGARARLEMKKRGWRRWGLATVKRSLAKLKKLGLVANNRRRPRGYYLEEAMPLLCSRPAG